MNGTNLVERVFIKGAQSGQSIASKLTNVRLDIPSGFVALP